jgi:hypothetical protein
MDTGPLPDSTKPVAAVVELHVAIGNPEYRLERDASGLA